MEEKKTIQWAKLDSIAQSFMDAMDDNLARTWFWMYLSGLTVEEIAAEYSRPKARIHMSLKNTIERYNQFRREEKYRLAAASQEVKHEEKNKPVVAEQELKPEEKKAPPKREKVEHKKVEAAVPTAYRPKKQARKIYAKLKKRVDSQFDKKFFIGDIRVSQEEYEELLEYTRLQLKNVTSTSNALGDAPVLAVAMVQIGIRCYNGNFWGNALKQELKVENAFPYQRFLGDSFIQTLKKHNKYIPDETERVQTILFHSFVTDYYSKGLFELLFQYYVKDLERDIYRNDKYQMQALMDTLRLRAEMSEEESQAFTDQFSGRGSRAYKLRQHTLQAIAANPTHSSMRLRRIIRLMDKAFWKDSVPQRPTSRLTVLFKDWLQESPSFNSEYKLYKSGVIRNRGKKHFSSPYLFADIRNTAFSLVFPSQIVRQEQAEGLMWRYTVNGKAVSFPVDTYPVLTGFKTEEVKRPISPDMLFSEIRCQLCTGDEMTRSFPPVPESSARIFDMEGDYANRIFKIPMCVYTRNDFTVKSPALLDRVRLGPVTRWDLEFVDGDILIFSDGKSLVAGERYTDGLSKRGIVNGASHRVDSEHTIAVYNRLPELLLTIPQNRIAGTILDVNGTRHRLSDCRSDDFESGDSRGVRAFLVSLSQFRECAKNAVNRIIVDVPGSSFAREYLFVYVPELSCKFDGAPYVFEERGTLVFPESIQVSCADRGAERLHGENGFQFLLSENLSRISVLVNQKIIVDFEVPLFMWSTDEREWHTEPMGDTWHSDFNKVQKIYCHSPESKLEFGMEDDYDESDDEAEEHTVACEKRSDGIYVLDLTRFRSWINRDKVAHPINMRLGSKYYEFARVYAKSFVSSCDLFADYASSELCCTAEFIGRGEYYVDITHLRTGVKVVEKGSISDGEYRISTRLRNGEYEVEFFETDEEDDLFDEVSYLSIHKFNKKLINQSDLSGNRIRVISFRPRRHSMMYTRFAEPLWVNRLEYLEPQTYEGHVSIQDHEDILVKVVFDRTKELRYFSLYFYDDYDEDYVDFLYDSQERAVALEEEPGLRPSARYRRYKVLFDSDYVYYGAVEE